MLIENESSTEHQGSSNTPLTVYQSINRFSLEHLQYMEVTQTGARASQSMLLEAVEMSRPN